MGKRKICVVITARPSYGRIKTALEEIQKNKELELQLVIAASALLDRYGNAVNFIERDGFEIAAKVYNVLEGENLTSMAKTTGLGILELSTVFNNLKPDLVVTIADRFETMATAIAASYMNIPLVHLQGGEVTGNIDEKVRHAITKLADVHFVCSPRAAERVIKMGEDSFQVYLTGCPSVDLAHEVLQDYRLDFDPFVKYGGVGKILDINKPYLVVMQHPVTNEHEMSRIHVTETLFAVSELNINTFWFWPNVDAGADGTSKGIRHFRENYDTSHIHFFKNMDPIDFLKLIKNSVCLIGNSSVGIRESAYLGIPVVNIGSRQSGRERGKNVIDVDYSRSEIANAINSQILHGHYPSDNVYGDGNAGKRIADLLTKIRPDINKKLMY